MTSHDNRSQIIDDRELLLLAQAIHKRGNDMQITHSKDGIKIFEINKRLIKEIKM